MFIRTTLLTAILSTSAFAGGKYYVYGDGIVVRNPAECHKSIAMKATTHPNGVQCKQLGDKTYCAMPEGTPLNELTAGLLVKSITYAQRPNTSRLSGDTILVKWYDGNVLNARYVLTFGAYEDLGE